MDKSQKELDNFKKHFMLHLLHEHQLEIPFIKKVCDDLGEPYPMCVREG